LVTGKYGVLHTVFVVAAGDPKTGVVSFDLFQAARLGHRELDEGLHLFTTVRAGGASYFAELVSPPARSTRFDDWPQFQHFVSVKVFEKEQQILPVGVTTWRMHQRNECLGELSKKNASHNAGLFPNKQSFKYKTECKDDRKYKNFRPRSQLNCP